jgi:hypothetical protein
VAINFDSDVWLVVRIVPKPQIGANLAPDVLGRGLGFRVLVLFGLFRHQNDDFGVGIVVQFIVYTG